MKKLSKRILSLILAFVTVLSVCPAIPLSSWALDGESTPHVYTYDEMYVDRELAFSWNGFELKDGDGDVTVLANRLEGDGIALTGTAGDGYVYSKSVLDFTPFLSYETAEDGAILLTDTTLEIVLKQIDGVPAADTEIKGKLDIPHVASAQVNAANFPDKQNKHPIDDSYGFISESYGVLAPLNGNANLQMPTDVERKPIKVFGNTQYESYTVGIVSDYTVTDKAQSTGTLDVYYYRDSVNAVTYNAAYDAHYIGNFNAVDADGNPQTPTAATADQLKLRFGGLGFGYQAIRVYNTALNADELAQNHAADLFAYYKIDLQAFMALPELVRQKSIDALTTHMIGKTSKSEIEAVFARYASAVEGNQYDELYAKDGLVFSWNGFDLTAADGTISKLENNAGIKGLAFEGTAGDGYLYSKGVLNFTDLIAYTTAADGARLLSDTTLEIVLKQIDGVPAAGTEIKGKLDIPHVASAQVNAANITDNKNKHPIDASYGFISESYGVLAPLNGNANLQMPTDVGHTPIKVFGNTQGMTYAFSIRSDYEITDKVASTGTLDVTYFRDGNRSVGYNAAYNAHYVGNWKALDTTPTEATASNLQLRFGGLGFGYQAIRFYNRALSDEEIMQNHAADLFSYYGVDLTAYQALSDEDRLTALSALTAYKIGESSKEEIEALFYTVTLPTLDETYGPLYVQNGLVYRWDGFDLTANGQVMTELTNLVEGGVSITRRTTIRETSGIGLDGRGTEITGLYAYDRAALFTPSMQLILTELLPYETRADGTRLPTDMTLEVSASYPSSYRVSPSSPDKTTTTGYDGGAVYLGPLGTIKFSKVNNNLPNGAGTMTDTVNNPIETWYGDFSSFDKGGISYIGNNPDKVFYHAFNLDYDEEATDYEKIPYSFSIGRDGSYVYSRSGKFYSQSADYSPYDGDSTLMQLTYGTTVATLYSSIRLYSRTLTELELQQNHTADLFKYYRVDLDLFNELDFSAKDRLYEALAPYQIGETSKEALESILANFALTGGTLGVVDVNDYLSFVGVQSRIEDYAAVRVRYAFPLDKIDLLREMGADLSFGILYGKVSDFESAEDLAMIYNPKINEFMPSSSALTARTVYYRDEWTQNADFLSMHDGLADFGATLPRIQANDPDFLAKANEQYYVRAFMAVSIDGTPFAVYRDLDTEEFGKTLSVSNANEFFLCNGYASADMLALTSSEALRSAALAGENAYLTIREAFLQMQRTFTVLQGAKDGAGMSSANYLKVESEADINMDLPLAMQMGTLAATSRTELSLYIELGLTAYEDASEALKLLREKDSERYALTLAALTSSGYAEEDAKATADKIHANAASMRARSESAMESAETTAVSLREYEETLVSSSAQNKISKVITPTSSLFLDETAISRYTIVTTAEYLAAAEQLQRFFLANQGAFVGIYQLDNPYIGSLYEPTGDRLIYVGISEEKQAQDGLFSAYMKGSKLYFEGHTLEALKAAVTAFTRSYCVGTGRIRLSEESLGNALTERPYVPMILTNIPESYGKITVSSFDANGVWEGFLQTVQNKPDEMTVVEKKNPSDFTYSGTLEIIVAPNGNDETGNGTLENPYATLDRALTAVAYRDGAVIKLRGGTYALTKTVSFTEAHSGSETSPLIITAYEGEKVSFTTGKVIDTSAFTRAADADFLTDTEKARLETFTDGNAQKVYAVELSKVGISSLSSYVGNAAQPKLYVNGDAYRVARFPNAGEENEGMSIVDGRISTSIGAKDIKNCGRVTEGISSLYNDHKNDTTTWEIWLDDGDGDATNGVTYRDRVLAYDLSSDILWTSASVYEEWHKDNYRVTVETAEDGRKYLKSATASSYGAKHAKTNGLYFFNMLEDLDAEGEYLVNPSRGILYLYAPNGLSGMEVVMSTSTQPPFSLKKADNVLIDGITFEQSAGVGLYANECENLLIQNCTFQSLGSSSIDFDTCFNSGVIYCNFYDCGEMLLSSTMTGQLIPNRCFIQNNRFENATETASLAIRVGGMANVISHNYFYETTISHTHNLETVTEYNEFVRGSQITQDNGPIYTGYTGRGMIIRYNYLHDLNYSGYGIYVDDMGAEHYVYGNVVHYAEGASGRGINLHNGAMNVVLNNICINVTNGIQNNLNYYPKSIDGVSTKVGSFSYRWESIVRQRFLGYYNFYVKEKLDARYPMYALFTELVNRSVILMNDATWQPEHKITPRDNDEIFTRTPAFCIYKNNVFYNCQKGLDIPTVGQETCIIEDNVSYAKGTDVGFADYENGNFALSENSILFSEIDGFFAPPFEKMGLTK